MSSIRAPRVFVGVDGSLAGVRALRQGIVVARYRRAELHVVHVRDALAAIGGQAGIFALAMPAWGGELADSRRLDSEAEKLIADSLERALGGPPSDVIVRRLVIVGDPARALANVGWRSDDLLVVGTHGGRRWRHPLRQSVDKFCIRHARCPVLVVPSDEFVRTVRRRTRLHRSPLPRHLWAEFDAVIGCEGQRAA